LHFSGKEKKTRKFATISTVLLLPLRT